MKASEIINQYRILSQDKLEPYFVSDEEALFLLNQGLVEACIRGRLLVEDSLPEMCFIDVKNGQSKYQLHEKVTEVIDVMLVDGNSVIKLYQATDTMAERLLGYDWREREGIPAYFVQSDTAFELYPKPNRDFELKLRCHHIPLSELSMDDEPKIHIAHHSHLADWILAEAFKIPDTEFFDPNKSGIALQEFNTYFGLGTDSDLKRDTRSDIPQVVVAFMP